MKLLHIDSSILAGTAYQRTREGGTSLRIEHGRPIKPRHPWLETITSISAQSWLRSLLAMILARACLIEDQLGTPPLALTYGLAIATVLFATFFLLVSAPGMSRDLHAIPDRTGPSDGLPGKLPEDHAGFPRHHRRRDPARRSGQHRKGIVQHGGI